MDLHVRVYNAQNLEAMRCLTKTAYMVLQYLVCRADSLGRCFPSAGRIAEDTGCHEDVVYRVLQTLEGEKYIGYIRRNQQDPATGRWLPNVYIVSPFFICLAEENQEKAVALWNTIYPNFVPTFRHFIGTNQQQEPESLNNASYPESVTNNNNQNFSESVGAGETPQTKKPSGKKEQKAKSEPPKNQDDSDDSQNQQSEASQRSKKRGGSAENPNYRNPDPIAAPIPDDVLERLANRVNQLGVPIPLARGFVMAYGGEICEAALLQLQATKSKGQEIKNEGGFFRHLLQNNLIDKSLPKILQTTNRVGYSWSDFAETP
jgi:hypothetical protein